MLAVHLPKVINRQLILTGTEKNFKAKICLSYSPLIDEYLETVKHLHPKELEYFFKLKFEKRIKSYLAGRYAAKRAVSCLIREKDLKQVLIEQGALEQPIIVHPCAKNIQVSITHCDDFGAAIVFPEALPMGIDIEKISNDKRKVLETQMTLKEENLIQSGPYPSESILTILWTAKEALSKILKTGLTIPFQFLEINKLEIRNNVIFSYFENFPQYCTASFIFEHYVCSITYPKRIALNIESMSNLIQDIQYSIVGMNINKI